jgi:hypothetical protein
VSKRTPPHEQTSEQKQTQPTQHIIILNHMGEKIEKIVDTCVVVINDVSRRSYNPLQS